MAAPTPTARGTPSGIKLDEGFRTLVTFASNPTIGFWEKEVTPPGLQGGDPVDTTTMHNVRWRTRNPRQLITMENFKLNCAYDPYLYTSLLALLNVKTTVTVTFRDGTTLAFYGFLQSFIPGSLKEGEQPMAEITVVPTNQDPTTGAEEDPVLTNVAGT